MSFLDRFREKPESERKVIAVIAALVITGIILIVWITTLGVQHDEPVQVAVEEAEAPFEGVWNAVETIFRDLGDQYREVSDEVKRQASTTPQFVENATTTGNKLSTSTVKKGSATTSTEGENMVE